MRLLCTRQLATVAHEAEAATAAIVKIGGVGIGEQKNSPTARRIESADAGDGRNAHESEVWRGIQLKKGGQRERHNSSGQDAREARGGAGLRRWDRVQS
ncbi:hypothetical protein Mapa_006707 [Marchantia paleacea]|nr:hypothetical protein Mapa_006707 [Marchantia paleacea]